jgi:hypothetical protein
VGTSVCAVVSDDIFALIAIERQRAADTFDGPR